MLDIDFSPLCMGWGGVKQSKPHTDMVTTHRNGTPWGERQVWVWVCVCARVCVCKRDRCDLPLYPSILSHLHPDI